MQKNHLIKVIPIAAIALSVYSTSGIAGGTNRGDNEAATPGPKATTTTTPADAATGREDMRRGTTNTGDVDTPTSASDVDQSGSGAAGGTGSTDKSMSHDKAKKHDKNKSSSGSDSSSNY